MMPFPPFSSIYYPRNTFYKTPPRNYGVSSNSFRDRISQSLPKENPKLIKPDTPPGSKHDSDTQYFDILGIRLYFDDILILCLLFFLYQEEVNDNLLFIALLLLLLS